MESISLIREKAEASSGVSVDELYKIDETNLVEKFGEASFITLCNAFYERVYSHEVLGRLFLTVEKEDMVQNMYEFLIERLGGDKYYSERKGTAALFHRHHCVPVTEETCDIWLELMQMSLRSLSEVFDQESCQILMNYFTYTAHSILIYHKEALVMLPELFKNA